MDKSSIGPAIIVLTAICLAASGAQLPDGDLAAASWIWTGPKPTAVGEWECYSRKEFNVAGKASGASVLISADNVYELFVNGKHVGEDGGDEAIYWQSVERYDITKLLKSGANVIAARGKCLRGDAGLVMAVRVHLEQGQVIELHTDETWPVSKTFVDGWNEVGCDDDKWPRATVVHKMGDEPWGMLTYPEPKSPMHISMLSWMDIGDDFDWPEALVFVQDYVPLRGPENFTVFVRGSRAYFEHDAACPPALGRKLCKLSSANPDGKITTIVDSDTGLIAAPCVSWDGGTIYFSMVEAGGKFFNIYSVRPDGSQLTQLTDGPYHDYEPAQLPDGRIIFSSTRIGSRDEYHGNFASALFAMNADGSDITPITYHIVADHEAKVTAQGTIAMVRCDNFFERAKVETRIHHVRPDGSGGMTILGPDRVAIGFDPTFAAERNSAWLRKNGFGSVAPLADGRIAAICQNGVVTSGAFDAGTSEFEKTPVGFIPFDISPLPDGRVLCTGPGRNWIGLINLDTGKAARIISGENIHSAVYLGPRKKPRTLASHLPELTGDETSRTGLLLCQSVFNTKQIEIDATRIKAVRIVQGKPFTLRSAKHRFDHIGVEGVELGTVPVAPDGSFYVEVPADVALSIQAIDAEGRSVINETSWIYVRPGERLSCTGCHSRRTSSPGRGATLLAARARPVKLLGAGSSHRYRANNGGNGGMLNLQYDRFREAAAITLFDADGGLTRRTDVERLCKLLKSGDTNERASAAQSLAVLRDRTAIEPLAAVLKDNSPDVRMYAALALSACGDRSAVEPLLGVLDDRDLHTAQAANVALENLTAHSVGFNAFVGDRGTQKWTAYFNDNSWPMIEKSLIEKLASSDESQLLNIARALGHVGGSDAAAALRKFVRDNQSGSLRVAMAAMRSLGYLGDTDATPLLTEILQVNMNKDPGKSPDLHELGWLQKPVYLTATAAEALGRIGTDEAISPMAEAMPKLLDFWKYTFWCGDHSWLMGCNSSPIHYRMLEAFDRKQTKIPRPAVLSILKSVPIDKDRALLFESDSYEDLVARVVAGSAITDDIIETCLSVLGDPKAKRICDVNEAVTASAPAVSVGPHDPQSRAAQIASVVCLDKRYAKRFCDVLDRYRKIEPSPEKSWVCFYIARLLGRLGGDDSIRALKAALTNDKKEVQFGYEDPPNVFVYKARTPFYRAAAAFSLGRIGDPRAVDVLMETVTDFDNAVSVRNAAAQSLVRLKAHAPSIKLREMAQSYPEVSTQRLLFKASTVEK